jgi:hypothetical protein
MKFVLPIAALAMLSLGVFGEPDAERFRGGRAGDNAIIINENSGLFDGNFVQPFLNVEDNEVAFEDEDGWGSRWGRRPTYWRKRRYGGGGRYGFWPRSSEGGQPSAPLKSITESNQQADKNIAQESSQVQQDQQTQGQQGDAPSPAPMSYPLSPSEDRPSLSGRPGKSDENPPQLLPAKSENPLQAQMPPEMHRYQVHVPMRLPEKAPFQPQAPAAPQVPSLMPEKSLEQQQQQQQEQVQSPASPTTEAAAGQQDSPGAQQQQQEASVPRTYGASSSDMSMNMNSQASIAEADAESQWYPYRYRYPYRYPYYYNRPYYYNPRPYYYPSYPYYPYYPNYGRRRYY